MTSVAEGVFFDINADGILDQTAWTAPDGDDAFLVLDRNENGFVDDGGELFGTATRKVNGEFAANGFDALVDLDLGLLSNGKIDFRDAAYQKLQLWLDRNHNGISEPEELTGLAENGILEIFTGYSITMRRDRHGNLFMARGVAHIQRRPWRSVHRWPIFDVYFRKQ
jgi:hypothetical protein